MAEHHTPELLGNHRSLYIEAIRTRWAWRGRLSTLPGRQRMGDEALRAYIDGVLVTRPDAHGNGEHLVALWLNRIICTGPRWHRLWSERVSAAHQRANAEALADVHPRAALVRV